MYYPGICEDSPYLHCGPHVWEIREMCIEDCGWRDGAVCRCVVVVADAERRLWREFALYYFPEWFELWETSAYDYQPIKRYTVSWVQTWLIGNRQNVDRSSGMWAIEAAITF